MSDREVQIVRRKTAVKRVDFSRPVRLALDDEIINSETDVLDYGCGRGDDLERLEQRGIRCSGWDPSFRPEALRVPAAVVNIGYVVNVIEDPQERAAALIGAWELTRGVLVVAARTTYEAPSVPGVPFRDGYLTQLDTFQKFYEQHELRAWIESTLNETSVPAGPGVFYVFRDPQVRQAHLASRCRRAGAAPRVRRSEILFEQHKDIFERLLDFASTRGRPPEEDEIAYAAEVRERLGGLGRALAVLRRVTDAKSWETIREDRTQDLLVYIALSRFQSRPKFSHLPRDLQLDIRAFFGNYTRACELADVVLFSAGEHNLLDRACRASSVGKVTPSALYVHSSALPLLPPLLRVYEGCARMYIGRVDDANIVKLHRNHPAISYSCYPRFDKDPHPPLAWSVHVPLQSFRVDRRDYAQSDNPPILHRKEEFVALSYPGRNKFVRLTRDEERAGLYADTSTIGTREGWKRALAERHLAVRGHRVLDLAATQQVEDR